MSQENKRQFPSDERRAELNEMLEEHWDEHFQIQAKKNEQFTASVCHYFEANDAQHREDGKAASEPSEFMQKVFDQFPRLPRRTFEELRLGRWDTSHEDSELRNV